MISALTSARKTVLGSVAIALALAISPAAAQQAVDPARLAAGRQLVEAAGGERQGHRAIDQMLQAMMQQVRIQNPTEAATIESVLRKVLAPDSPKIKAYFAEISDLSARFYAERFSIAEMTEMIGFLNTPAGKKFQDATPELLGRMTPAIQRFQSSIQPDIIAAFQEAQKKR